MSLKYLRADLHDVEGAKVLSLNGSRHEPSQYQVIASAGRTESSLIQPDSDTAEQSLMKC